MNDIKTVARKWYAFLEFPKEYDKIFEMLLLRADIDDTLLNKSCEEMNQAQDAGKSLVYALARCEALEKIFQKAKMPQEIFADTISDIKVWALDYYTRTKKFGTDHIWWLANILDFKLFKLGRLQYTFTEALADYPLMQMKKEDPVIGIHIPRKDLLTPEICKDSLRRADAFFAKYFPDFAYSFYTCGSWMLSPDLELFLNENSNVLNFKHMFHMVYEEENNAILFFIFPWGTQPEQATTLDAETSLQKKVQEHIVSGKKLHIGYGVIPKNSAY